MNNVTIILADIIITTVIIFIWHKLLNKKIQYASIKTYIIILLQSIISIINYDFMSNYFRMLIIFITMILSCKILTKESFKKVIITVFYTELIIIISEGLIAIIMAALFLLNLNSFLHYLERTALINILVAIVSILMTKINIVIRLYNKLKQLTSNVKIYQLLIFSLLLISSLSFIYMISYYSPNLLFTVIANYIICIIYIIIIMQILKSKNQYNTILQKHNNSLNDLIAYEKLVDDYNIQQHEYNNTLKTIRNMSRNAKINDYINTILKDTNENNKYKIDKLIKIPSGGLNGLLTSKINDIENKNIKYKIHIDKNLKYTDFNSIELTTINKICSILGVFLDNAIEETIKINDSKIDLDIFKENNNIYFSISNNYITKIDLNKIGTRRFSTKGKNHGYGLLLVKKLIDEEENLTNNTIVTKEIFKQILIVNIKK